MLVKKKHVRDFTRSKNDTSGNKHSESHASRHFNQFIFISVKPESFGSPACGDSLQWPIFAWSCVTVKHH